MIPFPYTFLLEQIVLEHGQTAVFCLENILRVLVGGLTTRAQKLALVFFEQQRFINLC